MLLLTIGLSGCASVSTWEATGVAKIKIDKVERRSTESGADVVVVLGTKTIPAIPHLTSSTTNGEVGRIPMEGKDAKIVVDVSGSFPQYDDGMEIVAKSSFMASIANGQDEPRPLHLHGRGGFLYSDLDCYRNYLVAPVRTEPWRDGEELWTVRVLENPWIPYGKDEYCVHECNAGTVARRLVIMPFALAVDIVTLPFQVLLGLFSHM